MQISDSLVNTVELRPTRVMVNLGRITENYRAVQRHIGAVQMMPILKANAYGHGLVRIGQLMQELGANMLGVAFLEEGIQLREAGVTAPILVLGGITESQVPLFLQHDLTITASSVEKLEQVDSAAASLGVHAKVHLKIDTGMERIGVHYYSAEPFLEKSLHCKNITVHGIFSHFANSDSDDLTSAKLQLERFLEALRFYERRSIPTPIRHMANSGAILQLKGSWLDMVRPGIILYGVYPSAEVEKSIHLAPALSWTSRVVYFKVVQPGHPVSYGSTWQSDHAVRMVTIPAGYGDGYFRSMSGKAQVLIAGKRYPIVGAICMDQFMVNIEQDSAYTGDEVILIGESGQEKISVSELAEWAGTIPYEILTSINGRVPRMYRSDD